MGIAIQQVAERLRKEIGTSPQVSYRIARKLNDLAKSVTWATPVEDGAKTVRFSAHRRTKQAKSQTVTAKKTRRKQARKHT
jgi:hypothetical protein